MTYFVEISMEPPHFRGGALVDFEKKVPEVKRRAEIAGLFMGGRGLLDPVEMPTKLSLRGNLDNLADVFHSNSGVHIASLRFLNLLEELDPGLHQFLPIEVVQLSGVPAPGEYFILNVHHTLDTIIDQKSKVENRYGEGLGAPIMFFALGCRHDFDIAVDKSKLTNVSIWRERRYPGRLLLSNRLKQRMDAEGVRFFEVHKALEE